MKRVVVTGIGLISPLGEGLDVTMDALIAGRTGVRVMEEFQSWKGLRSHLGAPQVDPDYATILTSKARRSMGTVAQLATVSSLMALEDANLDLSEAILADGRTGVAYGSGIGSTEDLSKFAVSSHTKEVKGLTALSYHKIMAHSCAANISIFFQCTGRLIPTSSACTSGSLAVGLAYEEIACGRHDLMIAGGAEALSPAIAAVFDVMFATSLHNESPQTSPAPFDASRDGMVVGGGACTLILEERERALERGAPIYAELIGFATNADGYHVTHPNPGTIETVMRQSLHDAGCSPGDIDYVNAHATGTRVGDQVEAEASYAVFGDTVPISSLKGALGHTLGACGAIEAALTLEQMNRGVLLQNRNLKEVDPECPPLALLLKNREQVRIRCAMSNTFAFGGVNTSLVFRQESECE